MWLAEVLLHVYMCYHGKTTTLATHAYLLSGYLHVSEAP